MEESLCFMMKEGFLFFIPIAILSYDSLLLLKFEVLVYSNSREKNRKAIKNE